jgi:hypothetical protein
MPVIGISDVSLKKKRLLFRSGYVVSDFLRSRSLASIVDAYVRSSTG